tara:strand:- start:776 stop:1672 length:897 start_codon:yes stop_codon:yes gene_type:complete
MKIKKIILTGASGFVGQNLCSYLPGNFVVNKYKRGNGVIINSDTVIHLAGKAHDVKNAINSNEYYEVNTNYTRKIFNAFMKSEAKVFIFMSSVKAVADSVVGMLTESHPSDPQTHYGKSKSMAEKDIQGCNIPASKRVYILRPCMIHGPGNKGNLNLLYKLVSKGIPWPLGLFENKRSVCSIGNLLFVIKELIEREDIPSGVYNVADDVPISTNELIQLIAESNGKRARLFNLSKSFIRAIARLGDFLKLPLNSERLRKLTESYVVSNVKIKGVLGKPMPESSKDGLIKTFQSFTENA